MRTIQMLCINWSIGFMSSDKKPRMEQFSFTPKPNKSSVRVTYDQARNGFILPDAIPDSIKVERSYERDSGKPKILSSVQGVTDFATFDIDSMIMAEYDYLISIDTNSREWKGNKISICTAYSVPEKLSKYIDGVPFHRLDSYIIVNPRLDINPEKIGWALIISNLRLPIHAKGSVTGIIVDSEKDSLPAYNSGKKPFFETSYLPKQLKFCYASDKDKDTLTGQMLKMCHNVSNQIFRQIELEKMELPTVSNGADFCDGYIRCEMKNA